MKPSAQLNIENFEYMRAQPPREFDWLRIDANYNCNVHCVYCHSNRSDQTISLEDLEAFLKENVLGMENVQFGCVMEPTLDKRLIEVMNLVSNSSVAPKQDMVVQTNGIILHTHDYEEMVRAGLTHLSVSIDSINPKTLATLRGGSSFKKISRNLVNFRKKCPSIYVQILTTVTKANIDEIADLVSWGIEIGARRFVLREVFHYPNNDVVDHERTLKLMLDPGQFQSMQQALECQFGGKTNFHFAPSEDLRNHARNVHKSSYERTDGKKQKSE